MDQEYDTVRADKIKKQTYRLGWFDFNVIDTVMMSILVLMLITTNALDLHLPCKTKEVLKNPAVNLMINIAFIFFTIVWTQGRDKISPWHSLLLSMGLFVLFVMLTRLPVAHFVLVIAMLILYFIVHHMQVYRATIDVVDTRDRSVIEHAVFAISPQTHEFLMNLTFYGTLVIILLGFSQQVRGNWNMLSPTQKTLWNALRKSFIRSSEKC